MTKKTKSILVLVVVFLVAIGGIVAVSASTARHSADAIMCFARIDIYYSGMRLYFQKDVGWRPVWEVLYSREKGWSRHYVSINLSLTGEVLSTNPTDLREYISNSIKKKN